MICLRWFQSASREIKRLTCLVSAVAYSWGVCTALCISSVTADSRCKDPWLYTAHSAESRLWKGPKQDWLCCLTLPCSGPHLDVLGCPCWHGLLSSQQALELGMRSFSCLLSLLACCLPLQPARQGHPPQQLRSKSQIWRLISSTACAVYKSWIKQANHC